MSASAAIAFTGVGKDYGRTRALSDLTLEVAPGETLGVLGPNGAGKTSAIRILLDLIRPTEGRAAILGHDCQRDGRAARAGVGYLPGDVHLPAHLDGRALLARMAAVRGRAAGPARVSTLTERLGADLGRRVGELSKGNRQAVAILLALAHRPPVLILDEPTSGLDPIRQREVLEILAEEAAAGAAVFFSSHLLTEVEHACRRVAVLRAGRLVALDTVAAITGSARHRYEVVLHRPLPPAPFTAPGVVEVARAGDALQLEVAGEAGALIAALAPLRVRSLRSLQTGLEDAVLHLYRDAPP